MSIANQELKVHSDKHKAHIKNCKQPPKNKKSLIVSFNYVNLHKTLNLKTIYNFKTKNELKMMQ